MYGDFLAFKVFSDLAVCTKHNINLNFDATYLLKSGFFYCMVIIVDFKNALKITLKQVFEDR